MAKGQVSSSLKDELTDPTKRAANLRLLKALTLFGGSIIVARAFGEALFGP